MDGDPTSRELLEGQKNEGTLERARSGKEELQCTINQANESDFLMRIEHRINEVLANTPHFNGSVRGDSLKGAGLSPPEEAGSYGPHK